MIQLRIAEILKDKGISKTEFAETMGVKKQNVNLLLETNNIRKLEEIADALGIKLTDLWTDGDDTPLKINGYIEFEGEIYPIKTIDDFLRLHSNIISNIDTK